jgi:hypothetical protein
MRPATNKLSPAAATTHPDAVELADMFGGAFSRRTLDAVEAAPPQLRAPLLLGSPDFMMR